MIISQTNNVGGVNLNTTGTTNEPSNTLSKEDFYKLLITQLQNQDPLNPLNPDQMLVQISQLGQLEALNNMEDYMKTSIDYQTSLNNLAALNLIGKEVTAQGNIVYLDEDGNVELSYLLNEDAQKVTISIFNQDGEKVRTMEIGTQEAGERSVNWDGRDDEGNLLPSGKYTFKVTATTADNTPVDVITCVTGKVVAAEFDNGNLYLRLEGSDQPITLDQILTIEQENS